MKIEFQCNYEDFREASLGHLAGVQPTQRGWKTWRELFLLLFSGAFAAWAVARNQSDWFLAVTLHRTAAPSGQLLLLRCIHASLPGLLYAAPIAYLSIRQIARRAPGGWTEQRRFGGSYFLQFAFTGLAFLLALMIAEGRLPWLGSTSIRDRLLATPRAFEIGLATLPWFVLMLFLVIHNGLTRSVALRRRWEMQPELHERTTLTVAEDGLVIETLNARYDYRWVFFPGFRETASLLLLYISANSCWMIPKRAFQDPASLDSFKGLLMTYVKDGHFLPTSSAFPVQPATPVAR